MHVRDAGPEDAAELGRFLKGLSLEARRLRFFTGAPDMELAVSWAAAASERGAASVIATIGEPGFAFHDKSGDGTQGPELVVLDAKVAMARHEVTRGEFRRFWNAAGQAQFAKDAECGDRERMFSGSGGRNWPPARAS